MKVRPPELRAYLGRKEIHAHLFAGGGGGGQGDKEATGEEPEIAINHWPVAIAMHKKNHPKTAHYTEDVFRVDPRRVTQGRPVALLWLSPDCTQFSKAKGGKPLNQKIRCLCWSAFPWIKHSKPRVIILENVEEFRDYGPLHKSHSDECLGGTRSKSGRKRKCRKKCHYLRPIAARKGQTFRAFVRKLEGKGYVVEHRLLRACDYGAPTTRRRLFLIARRDGKPIRWPTPTHGTLALPYRTAASCIDWSIPCPSIFDRKKSLSPKTEARIARGIRKFVLDAETPFVIPASASFIMPNNTNNVPHGIEEPVPTITSGNRNFLIAPTVVKAKTHGGGGNDARSAEDPLATITSSKRGEFAIATATIIRTAHGDEDASGKRRGQGAHDIEQPLGTVCASGTDFAIAVPYLVHRGNGERAATETTTAQEPRVYDVQKPLGTIVGQGEKHAACVAFLAKGYSERESGGFNGGSAADKPMGTVTQRDHHSAVVANLIRYNGERRPKERRSVQIELPLPTQDTSNRYGLVASHLIKFQGTSDAHLSASASSLDQPTPSITAGGWKLAQVSAFLVRYNGTSGPQPVEEPLGTVDAKDRFGLVTVEIDGEPYVIVDIGMRMLTPRELFRAQGFGDDYDITPMRPGGKKPITKTDQVRLCGNAVPPPFARALIAANVVEPKEAA